MLRIAAVAYRLSFDVDASHLSFEGRETVTLDAAAPELVLNSSGLEIQAVEVGGREVPHHLDEAREELRIEVLPPGTNEVRVRFRGTIRKDALSGFYRSRHGKEATLLTTHLAPTAARRLFPCIDHPAAKAVFHVDVTTASTEEVLFNTDAVSVEENGARKTWTFAPTPKMSTYLLYLGVGRFDTESERRGNLTVRVRAPPGQRGSCAWGLDNGHRSVEEFARYFGIPYPLPKLDLISVHDFAAGAMENWGAITFRESYLLADERTSTFLRMIVAEVVAHEVAHQWFGNLVTMEWWNDIWLNESFATIMSFKAVDRFYPSWNVFGQFLVQQTGGALSGDALDDTHPIDVPVPQAKDVNEIFDEISYGKGGSVLRMLEAFVGEETFRRGVADYLQAHAYGNAKGDDLWEAIERTSGQPIRRIVDPWIHRSGHPVVIVERRGQYLALAQRRFRLAGEHPEVMWPIPLCVRLGPQEERHLFDAPTMTLPVPARGDFSLNAGSVGFYRVLYDRDSYRELLQHYPELPNFERWSLLRDLSSFLSSGDVDPGIFREFLLATADDPSSLVVFESASQILGLYNLLGPGHRLVREGREILARQGDRLGLSRAAGEPASAGITRDRVTYVRAIVDPEFAHALAPRFRAWGDLDPDLRTGVAVAYARGEGARAFEPLHAHLKAATNEGETEQLLAGFLMFQDPTLVARALDWASAGGVSRGVLGTVGTQAAMNQEARAVTWSWFLKTLPLLEKTYQGTAMLALVLERVIPYVGVGQAEEVRRELEHRTVVEGERAIRKGLQLLDIRERLARRLA